MVILPHLRARILQELHDNHPGTSRMKNLARKFVSWLRMDEDISRLQCRQASYVSKIVMHHQRLCYIPGIGQELLDPQFMSTMQDLFRTTCFW